MWISKILKRKLQPKSRGMYACLHGEYASKLFVYISKQDDNYNFLIIPDMINITMTFENFKTGVNNKIIDFINITKKQFWDNCNLQYLKNLEKKQ